MRLYDTLLKSDVTRQNYLTSDPFSIADVLPQAVRYDIANVALYYWQNDKTYWDIAEPAHFPSLAPPHPYTWLEYKMPTRLKLESGEKYAPQLAKERMGCLVTAIDRKAGDGDFSPYTDETKWVLEGYIFIAPGRGRANNRLHAALIEGAMGFYIPVNGDGSLGGYTDESGPFRVIVPTLRDRATLSTSVAQHAKPFLLTFAFLSCNNVLIVDHDPRPRGKRSGKRKKRRQPVSYRTLEIAPLRDVLRVRGKTSRPTGRRLRSVSITRGHFRTYTESGKLFGKYTGRFWIPSHVKGRGEKQDRDREIKI